MTDKLKYGLFALALIGIGIAIGRMTIGEKTIEIPIEVKVPTIEYVTLPAVKETVKVIQGRIIHKTDTLWLPTEDDVELYSATLDTTRSVLSYIVQDDDTTVMATPTTTHLEVEFIGHPYNKFNIAELSFSPFVMKIPYRERVIRDNATFSLEFVGASRMKWNGFVSELGLKANFGSVGLGYARRLQEGYNEAKFSYILFRL
jgi:hypothetical protein